MQEINSSPDDQVMTEEEGEESIVEEWQWPSSEERGRSQAVVNRIQRQHRPMHDVIMESQAENEEEEEDEFAVYDREQQQQRQPRGTQPVNDERRTLRAQALARLL